MAANFEPRNFEPGNFEQRQGALIDLIYDAVLDASLWSRVLEGLSDLTRSGGGLIHGYAVDREFYTFHDLWRIDPDCKRRHELYHVANPWMRSGSFPVGYLLRSDDIVPLASLKRSAFYADVLQPQNFAHCATVILAQRPDLKVSLNLERSEALGPYGESDLRPLAALLPHLRRASELRLRMLDYQVAAQAERDALDALATGIVTFDATGRVLFANAAARSLSHGLGLEIETGAEIAINATSLTGRLRQLIVATARSGAGGSLHIADGCGLDINVTVLPVRGRAMDHPTHRTSGRPAAMALLTDTAGAREAASALLAARHDLTAAELRVASALSRGEGMPATAEALGISLNTLKTHAKRIYAKAGVRGQADLVRLMAQLAPTLAR